MIYINKELGRKIWRFLSSPITALAFSLIIGLFFYLISKTYKSPSYYFTPSELVAKKTNEDLKIYYKTKEVNNVYFTSLILWNDGEQYIDYSDFIKSKPIRFYSNDSIQILSVSEDRKSRKDLIFESQTKNDNVSIILSNDEALEYGDGVSFNILFTKLDNKKGSVQFELESRVKGTNNGFQFKDLTIYKKNTFGLSIILLWVFIVVLIAIRIVTLLIFKKDIVFKTKEFVFIITLISISIYLTIQEVFYSTNLGWL